MGKYRARNLHSPGLITQITLIWFIFYMIFQPVFTLPILANNLPVKNSARTNTNKTYGPATSLIKSPSPITNLNNTVFHPTRPLQQNNAIVQAPIFGPKIFHYTGQSGQPQIFKENIDLPSWAVAPFSIIALTGNNGLAQIGKGAIALNGKKILRNQQIRQSGTVTQAINLTAQNKLKVRLDGGDVQILIVAAAAPPTASKINPNSAKENTSLTVKLTGNNFLNKVTGAVFGSGISVGDADFGEAGLLDVTSLTEATAHLTIDGKAALGPRTVFLGNGTQITPIENGFNVDATTPPGRSDVVVNTFAGSGDIGLSDGQGSSAKFNQPMAIATDQMGNLYVADSGNNAIRFIDTTGKVSLLAGNGQAGSSDGLGPMASFNAPMGIAIDNQMNVYVADTGNNLIRKIDATGKVSIIAGTGSKGFNDGVGRNASFNSPIGIDVDQFGRVFVADTGNHAIRSIDVTGMVLTVAGDGNAGFSDGQGRGAEFHSPTGITITQDSNNNNIIYVADTGNQKIRRIDNGAVVSTFAGEGEFGFFDGAKEQARFADPVGVLVDQRGRQLVVDSFNSLIREINGSNVLTLAGSGERGKINGTGNIASFDRPMAATIDKNGVIYVADSGNNIIRRVQRGINGPVINSFLPTSGTPGAEVTIDGAGFNETTSVLFAQAPANFQVINDNRISAICPDNALTGPITIITPAGQTTSTQIFTVAQAPDFSLTSNPQTSSITAGQTVLFNLKAIGAGGFNGPVLLSTKGLPASIQATFSPNQLNANGPLGSLVLVADASLIPADYAFEIVGTATINGQTVTHSLPIKLTKVNDGSPVPDFQLAGSPNSATVNAGGSTTININSLSINGFQGNIDLSIAGLPSGASATLNTSSLVAGQSAVITLATSSTQASTSFNFTVTGKANINGQLVTRNITINVSVGSVNASDDFIIFVSPDEGLIFPDGQISYNVTINSLGTFNQDVKLSTSSLPAGLTASFNPPVANTSKSSILTLTAANNIKAGKYTFNIIGDSLGSKGTLTNATQVTLFVGGTKPITTLKGVVMTSEDTPQPLAKVTLSSTTNPAIQVVTDSEGRFKFNNLPPVTHQLVGVDGHTSDNAADSFPVVFLNFDIVPNEDNDVGYIIYLPKIDTSTNTKIEQNSDHEQVITSPKIPNFKAVIPAHTTLINLDGTPVTQVSVTALRGDRAPMPLPAGVTPKDAPIIFTLQPGGAVASKPIEITYPNMIGMQAGDKTTLWTADHDLGFFKVYGGGIVSKDGKQVDPRPDPNFSGLNYGLRQFSWDFTVPRPVCADLFGAKPRLYIQPNPIDIFLLNIGTPTTPPRFRVLAQLNGMVTDVTYNCSFESLDKSLIDFSPSGNLVVNAGIFSSSLNKCPQTKIRARLMGIPVGNSFCTLNEDEMTAEADVRFDLDLQIAAETIDQSPFRFINDDLIVLEGAQAKLKLKFTRGSKNVLVTDDKDEKLFSGLVNDVVEQEIIVQPDRPLVKLKIQTGMGCKDRIIRIFQLPNANIKPDPNPVPITKPTPASAVVMTKEDVDLKVKFNFSPQFVDIGSITNNLNIPIPISALSPVRNVEVVLIAVDAKTNEDLKDPKVQLLGTCPNGEDCKTVLKQPQTIDLSKKYDVAIRYSFSEPTFEPIIGSRKRLVFGALIVKYKNPVKVKANLDTNGNSCPSAESFQVQVAEPALIQIDVKLFDQTLTVFKSDGPKLAATATAPTSLPVGNYKFTITATTVGDNPITEMVEGDLMVSTDEDSVLPVGHTIVKGVDIADGHLVQSVTDAKIPGRGLSLEFTRTYSTTAVVKNSPLGLGWADNYHSRLLYNRTCNTYTLVGGEGQGQRFSGDDLRPQRGYHGRLVRSGDGFDFISKEGVVSHYATAINVKSDSDQTQVIAANLQFIREPNGNQITFNYVGVSESDAGLGLLTSVTDSTGRSLQFSYALIADAQRITQVNGPLGMSVQYRYDNNGNLIQVERVGSKGSPNSEATQSRIFTYRYTGSIDDDRTLSRMISVTDPNNNTTFYDYFTDDDIFPGEGLQPSDCQLPNCQIFIVANKVNRVRMVREAASNGQPVNTSFSYNFNGTATSGTHSAVVTDARGNSTSYVINKDGAPTIITQPTGIATKIIWSGVDIYKDGETDANGRLTTFKHDVNANMLEERIFAVDPDTKKTTQVVTEYTYDANFNRLTSRTDPHEDGKAGQKTLYEIDGGKGNLKSVTDVLGHKTLFNYDANGNLKEKIDSRGFHTTFDYSGQGGQYGNPTKVIQEVGNGQFLTTENSYDDRSRLISTINSFGRKTEMTYDELDRVVKMIVTDTSPNSQSSSPAVEVNMGYYANGEMRFREVSAVGGLGSGQKVEMMLDSLNRVIELRAGAGLNNVTKIEYDNNSNRVKTIDARGVTQLIEYDKLNRPVITRIQGPFGGPNKSDNIISKVTYDAIGNVISQTNLNNNTAINVYDGLNRLRRRILPENNPKSGEAYQESFVFDVLGNMLSATNANNQTVTMEYDTLSRLVKTTDPLGRVNTIEYAANDSSTNPRATHDLTRKLDRIFEYDGLNRSVKQTVSFPDLQSDNSGIINYTSTIEYNDIAHTVITTDPRGVKSFIQLDGFDRAFKMVADKSGNGLNITSSLNYDQFGNRTKLVDANGKQTTFNYDEFNRLIAINYPANQLREFFDYDEVGLLKSRTDRNNNFTQFTYDNLQRPLTTILSQPISSKLDKQLDPMPAQLVLSSTSYDDQNKSITVTDAEGHKVRREFDNLNRIVKTIEGVGIVGLEREQNFIYDGSNLLSKIDFHKLGQHSNITTFVYDSTNRLISTTDPANRKVDIEYRDNLGQVISTDVRGIKRISNLDALGRLITASTTSIDGQKILTERNQYDANSNLIESRDALNNITINIYDNLNRLVKVNRGIGSPEASSIEFRYDNLGNLLQMINGHLGATFTYDELGRRMTSTNGANNTTKFEYDGVGNIIKAVDPFNNVITFAYDELNALLEANHDFGNNVNGSTQIIKEQYRYNKERSRRADYRNDYTIVRNYDALSRLIKLEEHPGSDNKKPAFSTTTFDYDVNDNLIKTVDANNQVTQFDYDNLNRLVRKSYPTATDKGYGPVIQQYQYQYSETSQLIKVLESRQQGSPVSYLLSYDAFDRLASETDGFGKTTQFTYFDNGLRRSLIDPNGNKVNYNYDALNRLTSVNTSNMGVKYQYFGDDLLKAVTNLNGGKEISRSDYNYDPSGRIASVVNQANGLTLSSYNLQYNDSSNQIKLTEQQQVDGKLVVENTTFTFGKMSRLVKAEYSDGNAAYQYDASGNRAQEDLDGKRTSEGINGRANDDNPNKPIFDLVYDEQDRLRLVRDLTTKQELARYEYNFQGQRVKKTTASGEVISTYDGDDLIAEYDGQLNPLANYVNGITPIVRNDLKNGNSSYYQFNHLGSVVNLIGSGGQQLNSYRYDAWGVIRDKSSLTNSNNRLTFTAQLYDDETGFYSFGQGVRYMDASIGRFLQRDPLFGQIENPLSLNRYTYTFNNPLRFIDPSGLEGEDPETVTDQFGINFKVNPGEISTRANIGFKVIKSGLPDINIPEINNNRRFTNDDVLGKNGVAREAGNGGTSDLPFSPTPKPITSSNDVKVTPIAFPRIPTPTAFFDGNLNEASRDIIATSGANSFNDIAAQALVTLLGRLNQGNQLLINGALDSLNGIIGAGELGVNLFNDPRGTIDRIGNGISGLIGSARDTAREDVDFFFSPIQGFRAIGGAFRDNPAASVAITTGAAFDAGLVIVGGVRGDFKGIADKIRGLGIGSDIVQFRIPPVSTQVKGPASIAAGISASTPGELFNGYGKLTIRQQKILDQLPDILSKVIVKKSEISVTDLARFTAVTGDEFALFTRGSQRLIVRGSELRVPLSNEELTELFNQGFKFSSHTHPGIQDIVLDSSSGDRDTLGIFKQKRSLILNSGGRRNIFDKSGDILRPKATGN